MLVLLSTSGCCVLWYCGPALLGSACDTTTACPTGYLCVSNSTSGTTGFCTRPCSAVGTGEECMLSGDQYEGVCAPIDAGLACMLPCDTDGGSHACTAGLQCLPVDGGTFFGTDGLCL